MHRRSREDRRNLNIDEMESMGFVDMWELSEREGWCYDDCDDMETTECYRYKSGDRLLVFYEGMPMGVRSALDS